MHKYIVKSQIKLKTHNNNRSNRNQFEKFIKVLECEDCSSEIDNKKKPQLKHF